MEIRHAREEQLDEIMEIYAYARRFMREHGNPHQWGDHFPSRESVQESIEEGIAYVCLEAERIQAVFVFFVGEEPTYRKIYEGQWLADTPGGVVHRVASAPDTRGAASFCLNWCFDQVGNLRIDTHRDNIPMQNLLRKLGFQYCGRIVLEDGSDRLAYQKRRQ